MNVSITHPIHRCAFLVCILTMLSAYTSCVDEAEPAATGTVLTVGDALPAFTVVTNLGDTLTRDSFLNRRGVVAFFHTSCPDCRRALPVLDSLYHTMHADTTFRMVCISREESAASVEAYWQKAGLTMPYSAQSDRSVYAQFAHTGVPRLYITDSCAIIRHLFDDTNFPSFEELLKQTTKAN